MKLGKLAPRHDERTLKLEAFLPLELPAPPAEITQTLVSFWPMDANDSLGDCTCAAASHLIQVWSAEAGKEIIPTEKETVYLYGLVNGGVDGGAVCLDVLNTWRRVGLAGVKPLAYVQFSPDKKDHVQLAISLFGGAYVGVALPLSAQNQISSGLWTVTEGPDNSPGGWGGHCIPIIGYDSETLTCVTWGQTLKMTWEWFEKYCDESYAILPDDWQSVPQFNLDALKKELDEL